MYADPICDCPSALSEPGFSSVTFSEVDSEQTYIAIASRNEIDAILSYPSKPFKISAACQDSPREPRQEVIGSETGTCPDISNASMNATKTMEPVKHQDLTIRDLFPYTYDWSATHQDGKHILLGISKRENVRNDLKRMIEDEESEHEDKKAKI